MRELTVGEMKAFLANYPDDAKIVTTSSNFEMGHSTVPARISEGTYTKKTESFRDAFDGGSYNSEVYRHDPEGEKMIIISG